MKKKLFALLLVVAMLVSSIPVYVAAAQPTFVVSTVEATAGETFDITISVKNNPGIASIKLNVEFHPDLTLNSVVYNNALGGMSLPPFKLTSPATLNWFNGVADATGDWVFATLNFTVAEGAQLGAKPVTITYNPDDVYNIAETNIHFDIVNGGIPCPHPTKTEVPAKSPDCTTDGNNQYFICDLCGAALKADGKTQTTVEAETIPALGHSWVDATCTEPKTCSVCNATDGNALGHSFTNYVSNNDATCTADGTKTAKCDNCTETDTDVDAGSKKDHSWVDATCTEPKTCSVCHVTEGNALGHSYKAEWNQGNANGHWHDCQNCDSHSHVEAHVPNVDAATEETAKFCTVCGYVIEAQLDHTHRTTKVEGSAATCTDAGQKSYYICTCGKWFADSTANVEITDHSSVVIPALGHTWTDATCTAPKTCSVCGATEGTALGHDHTEKIEDAAHLRSEATKCTEHNTYWYECSRCDDISSEKYFDGAAVGPHIPGPEATEYDDQVCLECGTVITPALGHTHVTTKVDSIDATCTAAGQKTYYTCACGKWFADSTANVEITDHSSVVIPALGHDWTDATCTAPKTCDRCDLTEGEALGHDMAPATCTAPAACKREGCDHTEGEALGHTESTAWSTNGTYHWHDCEVCDEKIAASQAKHTDADENDICDICGGKIPVNAATGDNSFIVLWIGVMAAAACALIVLLVINRKRTVKE